MAASLTIAPDHETPTWERVTLSIPCGWHRSYAISPGASGDSEQNARPLAQGMLREHRAKCGCDGAADLEARFGVTPA